MNAIVAELGCGFFNRTEGGLIASGSMPNAGIAATPRIPVKKVLSGSDMI